MTDFAPVIYANTEGDDLDCYNARMDTHTFPYISVEAWKHWRQPLSQMPLACKYALSRYKSIGNRDGVEPCPICSAVEAALRQ